MKKKLLSKQLLVLSTLAIYCFLSSCSTQQTDIQAPEQTTKKPNIIFILADDLGYGELGSYGNTNYATPHIDKLAEEGIRFTDFYAGNTVCAPSRCSLMTGKHPGNASIRGNFGFTGTAATSKARIGINAEDITIGEVLQKAGYKTAHCGKWHLEGDIDTAANWPSIRGGYDLVIREHWMGNNKARRKKYQEETGIVFNPNFPYELWENGTKIAIEENLDGKTGYLMDDITTDYGLQFIREHKDNPFFVFFSMKIPHVPETFFPDDTTYMDKGWDECNRVHAARVKYHDEMAGNIVGLIDSLGLAENTIIMYSSDNGGHSEGAYKHPSVDPCKFDHTFFDTNKPLKGFKRDLYEGGIRVPFIVKWPAKVKPNTESKHVGAFWDVLATCKEIAEGNEAIPEDGISFLPTLLEDSQPSHDHMYWEFFMADDFRQAVRQGDWKAVKYRSKASKTELYNLATDIGETKDLSADYPQMAAHMDSIMENSHTPNPYFPYGGVSQ